MRMIGAAFSGAFTITFFWYFFNPWVNDAGIAFLRGQGWPVSTAWLMVVGGAVVGVIGSLRRRRKDVQQTAATIQTARDYGLEYVAKVDRPSTKLKCFAKWSHAKNGLSGVVDGLSVSLLDLTIAEDDSEGGTRHSTRTVVLLPAPGWPELTLRPQTWGWWIAEAIGTQGLTFDSTGLHADEAEIVLRFRRKFRIDLTSAPGLFEESPPGLLARETATRRLFGVGLMYVLLAYESWAFETDGEWVACWKGEQVPPANERSAMLATALEIRTALLTAWKNPVAVGLPARPRPTDGQYFARIIGSILGGLIGFCGGFFGGMASVSEWGLFHILVFVAAGVCGVTGVLGGYWLGVLVGLHPKVANYRPAKETPAQVAEKRRRSTAQSTFGCFGFFVGFVLGAFNFVVLSQFIFPNAQIGLWQLFLFFGFPLSGAILGIVVGAKIGGRFAGHRDVMKDMANLSPSAEPSGHDNAR